MGPIATGLGEIFMCTVEAEPGAQAPDGDAVHADRSAHDPGLDHQAAAAQRAGRRRGQHHRRLRAPDPRRAATRRAGRLRARPSTIWSTALRAQQRQRRRRLHRAQRRAVCWCARRARSRRIDDIRDIVDRHAATACRSACATSPRWAIGTELRTGAATENGQRSRARHGVHADRREQPRRVAGGGGEARGGRTARCPTASSPRTVYDRTALVDATIATVRTNLLEGALLVIAVLFLLLGNFRAALDHRAGDPAVDADHRHRHGARPASAPT